MLIWTTGIAMVVFYLLPDSALAHARFARNVGTVARPVLPWLLLGLTLLQAAGVAREVSDHAIILHIHGLRNALADYITSRDEGIFTVVMLASPLIAVMVVALRNSPGRARRVVYWTAVAFSVVQGVYCYGIVLLTIAFVGLILLASLVSHVQ
jgi:hypothetical protein